jgi:hypothetical protein
MHGWEKYKSNKGKGSNLEKGKEKNKGAQR